MSQIVECVPNFSEGQSKEIIDAIASAVAQTPGCQLLDVDPGPSTNRTVYTFVGSPMAVIEGALNMARVARSLIDMRIHKGEHPRMGALDVCPFIPISGVTMEDCNQCAEEFGRRLGEELQVPVYLYGYSAREEKRQKLPSIRAGEYEGIEAKVVSLDWKPDFGPAKFVPMWGATATGARKFLIAMNINVLGTKEQAHRIALNVREQGRGPEKPGRLKSVQAIGWWLDEYNLAQVSMNLTDIDETPMHVAFEECLKDSKEMNVALCGAQLVGLVPLKAILEAAEYYIERDNLFIVEESQKVRLAINRLGLSSLEPFNPREKIIEYMIDADADGPLASMSLKSFIINVGARSSAPGGGSVSAAIGAMGAALGTMVGWMSYGNKKFEAIDSTMRKLIPPLRQAMHDLIPLIDADTAAFAAYMSAMKMPKSNEEETAIRDESMKSAMRGAIAVPMNVAMSVNACWDTMKEMARYGNVQCKSDLQVGAKAMELAVWGAYYNVMINLPSVTDQAYKDKATEDIKDFLHVAQEGAKEVLEIVADRKE
ncbi:formimidoyltransferase-cyclodeaminase-like [Diadema setosum]|uniref:formimidoyltransferase-cyclodeaminase-like n=1 Tax=Diadema setosum TaxID=31175 RepID=UPI003B3BB61A